MIISCRRLTLMPRRAAGQLAAEQRQAEGPENAANRAVNQEREQQIPVFSNAEIDCSANRRIGVYGGQGQRLQRMRRRGPA